MQSDKELLMLAARAAGYQVDQRASFMTWRDSERLALLNPQGGHTLWNSLADKSDALVLMARLNINVYFRENINGAFVIADHEGIEFCPESLDGPDEVDATCRAITRAAASIAQQGVSE